MLPQTTRLFALKNTLTAISTISTQNHVDIGKLIRRPKQQTFFAFRFYQQALKRIKSWMRFCFAASFLFSCHFSCAKQRKLFGPRKVCTAIGRLTRFFLVIICLLLFLGSGDAGLSAEALSSRVINDYHNAPRWSEKTRPGWKLGRGRRHQALQAIVGPFRALRSPFLVARDPTNANFS